MQATNHVRPNIDVRVLDAVARGQRIRTVKSNSHTTYISKMRVMSRILWSIQEIRQSALFLTPDGQPQEHTGDATGVYKLKLPISVSTAQRLFAAISVDPTLAKKRIRRNVVDDGTDDDAVPDPTGIHAIGPNDIVPDNINPGRDVATCRSQTYQNYKSALKWWHEHHNVVNRDKEGSPWPLEVEQVLKQQVQSYKRDVGEKKRKGIMSMKEGMTSYNITGYITICKYFSRLKPEGHRSPWMAGIVAQLFTKLSVNTIGRSDNIGDINLKAIDWENDAMTLAFATTKSDVEGEDTSDKKRLYANPFLPETCVILGLAIYTWVKNRTNETSSFLFQGENQHTRYGNLLHNALLKIPDTIDLGCKRQDIGTHSNRKFAESTSVSKPDGPKWHHVCLRAGQSVGRTQDSYMVAEIDGDSLVGRTVAQLQFNADQFDCLPPRFDQEALTQIVNHGWSKLLPSYNLYPQSFQRVIPKLLASLVYHHFNNDGLKRIVDDSHPIYSTPLFTLHENKALLEELKNKILLGHYHCPRTEMSAQGIPGFIVVQRELRDLRDEYRRTCRLNEEQYRKLSEELQQVSNLLPQRVVDLILEQVQINGAQPLTLQSIRNLVLQLLENENGPLISRLNEIRGMVGNIQGSENINSGDNSTQSTTGSSTFHTWPGSDRLHRVPHGFHWPQGLTTNLLWNLWFFGDSTRSIGPYRYISTKFDLITKNCKVKRSRCCKVMDKLVSIAIEDGKITRCRDITAENTHHVFIYSYEKLINDLYSSIRRPEDLVVDSIYERMRLTGKTFEGRSFFDN